MPPPRTLPSLSRSNGPYVFLLELFAQEIQGAIPCLSLLSAVPYFPFSQKGDVPGQNSLSFFSPQDLLFFFLSLLFFRVRAPPQPHIGLKFNSLLLPLRFPLFFWFDCPGLCGKPRLERASFEDPNPSPSTSTRYFAPHAPLVFPFFDQQCRSSYLNSR